ncbi:MAG: TonB-dependent receptor [Prevotellaceae bacterium]|jgi:TonB-linked SusC/RagA family outer membrane protein|nr:TonB-dependent receptor [Prevotellaceae bacterium]
MKKIGTILTFLICMGVSQLYGQSVQITGTVTDVWDNSPLPGVFITIKGTNTVTSTLGGGTYSINAPSNATLVFSFIGMKSQEVQVNGRSVINVSLESDTRLDEVVVIGYGEARKRDVTSLVTKVDGGAIAKLATPSFDQQLAGRATGVQVTQGSGVIGSAPVIRVRGINSISSSTSPLYVVDGVPVTSGDVGVGYASNNAMGDINPDDIESINVLKDGAATAIYGSRASNGVILVTTKRGKAGKFSVSYNTYFSAAQASKLPDLMNGKQFTEIANELYVNNGNVAQAVDDGTNTNWLDYVFRTGFQHSHTLSMSGGTDKAHFYLSGGYSSQEGIIVANNYKRFTVRANGDVRPVDWFKAGVDINVSNQKVQGIVEGWNSLSDAMFAVIRMLPNVAVYRDDDPTGYNIDAVDRKALGRGSNKQVVTSSIPNIMWVLDNNLNLAESYRGIASGFVELMPIKGLSIKTIASADLMLSDDMYKWMPDSGDGVTYGGLISRYFYPRTRWNWQNIVAYSTTFAEKHNLDLTAVAEYNKYSYRSFSAAVQNFSDPFFMEEIIGGTFDMRSIGGGSQENGLASYLFRANYNYAGKYYLGGSIRRDGLSKLPADTRWGNFWGVSAAWRVSDESFWDGIRGYVNDLRIRGSFATVGNQGISGNYPYMDTFSPRRYGSLAGLCYSNVGNGALKWESQATMDLGFDAQFLNGRFNLGFSYWTKDNSDIVLDVPFDPSFGIPGNSMTQNIGQIKNSGLEFSIGADIVRTKDFSWHADVNFSTLKNEVVKLVDGTIRGTYSVIEEGKSMNTLWGYQYAGVNMANGNPMWHKADGTIVQHDMSNNTNTTYLYDASNPAVLGARASLGLDDKMLLGGTIPTWFGGFNNTLMYKNLDLSIFFRFSGGNKIYNGTRAYSLMNYDFANKSVEILDRWQSPEKPGNGIVPKIRSGYGAVANKQQETDSRYVENGSYLKLGNITLGYTLPRNIINKVGLSGVRIYASAQNIMTITKYSGFDPELMTNMSGSTLADGFGVEYGAKPLQRNYVFGINLSF